VLLHMCKQRDVNVAVSIRDRVCVFERCLLRFGEKVALRVVVEGVNFLRRITEPAARGSVSVLSVLAAVPPSDATVEQRSKRAGHTLCLLLEGGPHCMRSTEVNQVARVEQVWIERSAVALALSLKYLAQVVRERLYVDGELNAEAPQGHSKFGPH
jgi:hypothetical protein